MKFIFPLLFLFTTLSCSEDSIASDKEATQLNQEGNKIKPENLSLNNLNWLSGNWKDLTTYEKQKAHYIEKWESSQDSIFAKCISVQNGDSNIVAFRAIKIIEGKLVFIEHIPNRPLVSYRMDSIFSNGIRFENKAQNFPIQITYQRISADSLEITLYGIAGQFERTGNLLFQKY